MKAAIITHYYKSKNYGGNLQAYAMCKAIEKLGTRLNNFVLHQKRRCLVKFPSKKRN